MDTQETKNKIKQAVVGILQDGSGRKLNMRNISKETGLSPGTIYYHFPNKAEIVLEVVDDHWQQCLASIRQIKFDARITVAIEQLYGCILEYFLSFRSQWIAELSALGRDEIRNGRQFEASYMHEIDNQIAILLGERKEQISEECLRVMGMQGLTKFVYTNFMLTMKRGETDCSGLLYVIGKVIG